MTKRIPGGSPHKPDGQRTVVLAMYWANEALKRGVIDYARFSNLQASWAGRLMMHRRSGPHADLAW
jgi:hypothetical protein